MVTMNGELFALILSLLALGIAGAYWLGQESAEWSPQTRNGWDATAAVVLMVAVVATFALVVMLVLAGAGVITL